MATRWTNEDLEGARAHADPEADALAEKLMRSPLAMDRYNQLLDAAESLVAAPELALVDDSPLEKFLREIAREEPEAAKWFDPMPAPEWVDEGKLKLANELWQENTLACIAALYAASLPACYLAARGVPVLYKTEKLGVQRYIFQRIYETGLMLDRVMDEGGITVAVDHTIDRHEILVEIMNGLDKDGGWALRGPKVYRASGKHAFTAEQQEEVQRKVQEEFQRRSVTKRYLWGEGYVTAKKVRLLHASMRFILKNPGHVPPTGDPAKARVLAEALASLGEKWDTDALGQPINQQDMAFVLLTFGFLIPSGLESYGCRVSREHKDAFLHLWRVVGHVMGIRPELMTDNWDEAKQLYEQLLNLESGRTTDGEVLTSKLMESIGSYIPHRFGLRERLPAQLIIHQLGVARAKMIMSDELLKKAWGLHRFVFKTILIGIRVYFWLRQGVLKHLPFFHGYMVPQLHAASEEIIASWRDGFDRKPFAFSEDAIWMPSRGSYVEVQEFEEELGRWRRRLFDALAVAIGSLITGVLCLSAAVVLLVLELWRPALITALVGFGLTLVAEAVLKYGLKRIFAQRPRMPAAITAPK